MVRSNLNPTIIILGILAIVISYFVFFKGGFSGFAFGFGAIKKDAIVPVGVKTFPYSFTDNYGTPLTASITVPTATVSGTNPAVTITSYKVGDGVSQTVSGEKQVTEFSYITYTVEGVPGDFTSDAIKKDIKAPSSSQIASRASRKTTCLPNASAALYGGQREYANQVCKQAGFNKPDPNSNGETCNNDTGEVWTCGITYLPEFILTVPYTTNGQGGYITSYKMYDGMNIISGMSKVLNKGDNSIPAVFPVEGSMVVKVVSDSAKTNTYYGWYNGANIPNGTLGGEPVPSPIIWKRYISGDISLESAEITVTLSGDALNNLVLP